VKNKDFVSQERTIPFSDVIHSAWNSGAQCCLDYTVHSRTIQREKCIDGSRGGKTPRLNQWITTNFPGDKIFYEVTRTGYKSTRKNNRSHDIRTPQSTLLRVQTRYESQGLIPNLF